MSPTASTRAARAAAAADLDCPHTIERTDRARLRAQPDRRDRQRPHPPLRRSAAGRAHHRGRPGARRRRPRRAATRWWRSGRRTPRAATAIPATTIRRRSIRISSAPGRAITGRRGQLPLRHHQAGRLSVAQSSQRLASGAHPLLAVRPRLRHPAGDADVFPRRPADPARSDPRSIPDAEARAAAGLRPSTCRSPSPEWALGYRFDIVLRGRARDAVRGGERDEPHSQRVADRRAVLQFRSDHQPDARDAGARRRRRRAHPAGVSGAGWRWRAHPGRCHDRAVAGGRARRYAHPWTRAAARRTDFRGFGRLETDADGVVRFRDRQAGPRSGSGRQACRRRTSTSCSSRAACSSTCTRASTSRATRRTARTRCWRWCRRRAARRCWRSRGGAAGCVAHRDPAAGRAGNRLLRRVRSIHVHAIDGEPGGDRAAVARFSRMRACSRRCSISKRRWRVRKRDAGVIPQAAAAAIAETPRARQDSTRRSWRGRRCGRARRRFRWSGC